ncbi:uncharacterized, partial [Tachysurus ichikawai]
ARFKVAVSLQLTLNSCHDTDQCSSDHTPGQERGPAARTYADKSISFQSYQLTKKQTCRFSPGLKGDNVTGAIRSSRPDGKISIHSLVL